MGWGVSRTPFSMTSRQSDIPSRLALVFNGYYLRSASGPYLLSGEISPKPNTHNNMSETEGSLLVDPFQRHPVIVKRHGPRLTVLSREMFQFLQCSFCVC